MSRPRECAHEERYKDGHCKPCTQKRLREYMFQKRALERLRKARIKAGGPLLTLEELQDLPPRPPCDLI